MPAYYVELHATASFLTEADTPDQAQEIVRSLVTCGDFSLLDGEVEVVAPEALPGVRARVDHDLCEVQP